MPKKKIFSSNSIGDQQRREVFLYRIYLILGVFLIPGFGMLTWERYSFFERFFFVGFTSLFFTSFCLSFFFEIIKNKISVVLLCLYILLSLFSVYVTHNQNYSVNYSFGIVILFFSLSMVLYKPRDIVIYYAFVTLFGIISLTTIENPIIDITFIITFLIIFIFLGLVSTYYKGIIQEKVKQNEYFLQSLFNKTFDAIVLVNKQDGIIYDCNDISLELFKADNKKEIIGKHYNDFYEKKMEGLKIKSIVRSIEETGFWSGEEHFLNRKGEIKWCNSIISYIEIENREFFVFRITDIDEDVKRRNQIKKAEVEKIKIEAIQKSNELLKEEINERKKIEKQLIESEKYVHSIIDSSLDMICTADINGKIIEFNRAAQEVFGYTHAEVIGKEVEILYAENANQVRNALFNKQGYFSGEVLNKKKNGEIFTSFLSASVIKNPEGNPVGTMGVSRDITEKKAIENTIKESNTNYQALFNQAYVGIARISLEGNFIQANERLCNMLGYSNEEIIKKTVFDVTHSEDVDKSYHFLDEVKEGKREKYGFSKRYISKEGKKIDCNITVSIVRNKENKPDYFVTVFEDVTERNKSETELRESLLEKEILLKEVHHRVKNNLQVISSILNLQSAYIKDESVVNIFRESQNRIKSMSFIHESLYQTSTLSNINFSEYIRNLSNNLLHSYQVFDDLVNLEIKTDNISLNLDQAIPCGLILNELISNTLKHAFPYKKKGKVTVSIKQNKQKVTLQINDNGIGLDKKFSIEKVETLGLQLVDSLVKQLNGTIKIEINNGTKFIITFIKEENEKN